MRWLGFRTSSLSERNPLLIGQLCYTHMYEQKLQNR